MSLREQITGSGLAMLSIVLVPTLGLLLTEFFVRQGFSSLEKPADVQRYLDEKASDLYQKLLSAAKQPNQVQIKLYPWLEEALGNKSTIAVAVGARSAAAGSGGVQLSTVDENTPLMSVGSP